MNTTYDNINIIDEQTNTANGLDFLTVSYAIKVEGIDILFHNNIYVGPNVTVQLVAWQIGMEPSDGFIALVEHARNSLYHM